MDNWVIKWFGDLEELEWQKKIHITTEKVIIGHKVLVFTKLETFKLTQGERRNSQWKCWKIWIEKIVGYFENYELKLKFTLSFELYFKLFLNSIFFL